MKCRRISGRIFRLIITIMIFSLLALFTGESSAEETEEIDNGAEMQSFP